MLSCVFLKKTTIGPIFWHLNIVYPLKMGINHKESKKQPKKEKTQFKTRNQYKYTYTYCVCIEIYIKKY